jgi:hypothetical protein
MVKKEFPMKTLVSTFAVSAALVLSACNGQNPLKRNSDPTKDYPELNQAVPVSQVPEPKPTPTPTPVPEVEQNPCPKIFDIGFEEARGRLMKFQPGQQGQIVLVARSYRQGAFNLELTDAPKGMSLTLAKNEGAAPNSLSYWTVQWTPEQEIVGVNGLWETVIGVKYTNNNVKNARCGNHASEDFNVQVSEDPNAVTNPVVSITELPQGKITFGDHFNFKITVSNADSKQAPDLSFGFNSDAFSTSTTIRGDAAAGCSSAKLVNSQWVFSCDFASDKIADSETIKNLINKNKEVTARFRCIRS